MASAFTHGFTGLVLGRIFTAAAMPPRFWILSALCGILPDADAIGFKLGIPYGSTFGHRGFTHSILFAAIVGLIVVELAFRDAARFSGPWWGLVLYFFLVTISHSVLDAMTNGGHGVAFFSPFDNTRYFFPWRPVQVSPIGVDSFFSEWGLRVMVSEFLWIWLPLIAVLAVVMIVRRLK